MTFLPEKVHAAFQKRAGFSLQDSMQYACYVGSKSHNTYVPSDDPDCIDDIDILVVVVPPPKAVLGLSPWKESEHLMVDEWDLVIHSASKFIRLLLKGNPNMLSALWVRPEDRLYMAESFGSVVVNRKSFSTTEVFHSFAGYANGQLKKMTSSENAYRGYMGEKRKKLVDKFGFDCYEEESTEFLTNQGWKRFDDVEEGMLLATVRIVTGQLVFQAPQSSTDKLYTGEMFTVEPYSSRAVVTAEHKLLVSPMHRSTKNNFSHAYSPEEAEWQLLSPAEISSGRRSHFHIRRAPELRHREYDVPDTYLTLAGLFLSDGTLNFRADSVKDVRLNQTKPGRFNRMADDLMSVYPFRKYIYEKETIWSAHGDIAHEVYEDFGHAENKHLPDWCFKLSARQVEILWDALLAGDGTLKEANDTLYTSSPKLAGDVQATLVLAGFPAVIYGPYHMETNFGPTTMYHVVRSNTSGTFHALNFNRRLESGEVADRSKKEGFPVKVRSVSEVRVVCFEVPNGTLITRNSGKVAIHGNCKNAAHLIRLLRMCIEFMGTGELKVFRDTDAEMLQSIKKGEWPLQKVVSVAELLFQSAKEAYENSPLPSVPDTEMAERLLLELYRNTWKSFVPR